MNSVLRNVENLHRPLIIAAGLIGTLQGLIWSSMSLVAICFYRRFLMPSKTAEYFGNDIGRTIYDFYLNIRYESTLKATMTDHPLIITATPFYGIMIIYLIISGVLIINSCFLLWVSIRKKSCKYYKENIALWITLVAVSSLLDFILMVLLSVDYGQIKSFLGSDSNANSSIILTSTLVVLTLAIRGYILWIINVIFVCILGRYFYIYRKQPAGSTPSFTNANNSKTKIPTLPWERSTSQNGQSYINTGFQNDNAKPFTKLPPVDIRRNSIPRPSQYRSRDYQNSPNRYFNGINNDAPKPHPKPTNFNGRYEDVPVRIAKIGRANGQRTPPLNIPPPFIPEPDYTPPGSLRRNNNLTRPNNIFY